MAGTTELIIILAVAGTMTVGGGTALYLIIRAATRENRRDAAKGKP